MIYKIKYRLRKGTLYLELSAPHQREVLISMGIKLEEKDWDEKRNSVKKSNLNYERINLNIINQRNALEDIILKYQYQGKGFTPKMIKDHLQAKDMHNIFEFVEQYKKEYANKRDAATIENYRKHIKRLQEYVGKDRQLFFEEITPEFLQQYEDKLFSDGLKANYVSILMRTLKQIFLAAIKKQIIAENPFLHYERPKYTAPTKQFLTLPELYTLEKHLIKTKDSVFRETIIYFLFGCYTGLRVSDWYNFDQKKHIHNDFIELEAEKNNKPVNIPVSVPLRRILALMAETPLTIKEQTINEKLKKVMEQLNIHKKITTHCGRHTFAVTLCLSLEITSETAAKIMGITLQTFVDNYSQVTQPKITAETSKAWANLK